VTIVPGWGYAFVVLLSRPAVAPSRQSEDRTRRLPARLERIVGRDADILDITKQLSERRFVSVVGPGGMGKTTVAVAVAHALSADLDGDVCFVDLSLLTDALQVGASLASSLGLALPAGAPAEGFVAFLRDRRLLIVLDSCEHVLASVAPLTERSSPTARVRILATSRAVAPGLASTSIVSRHFRARPGWRALLRRKH
jgi:Mrp family chromosome partitioning ATPase